MNEMLLKDNKVENIEEFDDGTMIVKVSFDLKGYQTQGTEKHYDIKKYKKMVDNTSVQKEIAEHRALGIFGHRRRMEGSLSPYIDEQDSKGNDIIPVCKTMSMHMEGSVVSATIMILSNEKAKIIQSLIKDRVGGFSSVHNLTTEKFSGFDYVLNQRFVHNRPSIKRVCENGTCSILDDLQTEMDSAYGYVLKDDTRDNIRKLKTMTDEFAEFKAIEDKMTKLRTKSDTLDELVAKGIIDSNYEVIPQTLESLTGNFFKEAPQEFKPIKLNIIEHTTTNTKFDTQRFKKFL